MRRYHNAIIALTLSLVVISPSVVAADRLTVVASVFPLFDFAREVAGTTADVRLLLPPGVDPHSWEPRPSDIVELSRADIFMYTSGRMEPWADNFARTIRKRDTVSTDIMDSLGFASADERYGSASVAGGGLDHGDDPHFWLNLSLSRRAVEIIGEMLANHDPANGDQYIASAREYGRKLDQLDVAFKTGLEKCGSRQLVTGGHAAFGHLTRRYDLDQVSVYGLSPDAEPTPRHLAGIVNVVKENSIQTIFSEELMNPRMTEVLSQETGARVMVLNPGANLTAAQWREGLTFIDIMTRNLGTLKEGLNCE
jgi:zinc transport system substrate-binding protein